AGMGMVWSILAVYATTLGASTAMVGLLIAAFGGARLVVNLPAGLASEKVGRQPVMQIGLALLALASFVATRTTHFPALIACLLGQGVGCSMLITAALAALADLSTPESRVRDMAGYQGASSIGISIGPGIGGIAAAAWGYSAPFLLQGVFAVLAMVLLAAYSPKRRAAGGAAAAVPAGSGPAKARFDRTLVTALAFLTYGVFFARVAANWVLLPLVAEKTLGMSVAEIGMLLTAGAIANLCTLPLANIGTRRFGRLATIVAASAATVLSLLLLSGAHSTATGWIAGCLLSASSGLAMPILSAYAIDAAPPGAVGAAMGMLRMMTDLGIVTGPVIAGVIVDQLGWSYAGGLWFTGLVLALSAGIFWIAIAKNRRPP
ncbi:MAG: MFS transporter, partial [Alphaproteobacteria bacterium]|nr:MFS transporter [Alphaproteobacteria bacterium]